MKTTELALEAITTLKDLIIFSKILDILKHWPS
jgi:hypothetical protein